MKVTADRKIESPTKEVLTIEIEWDPSNDEQDGLAALIATTIDLVQKYHRLNTLAGD